MNSTKRISKILLKAGNYYVFSYKNSSRPGLDGKLELIGGNIEANESPFEGLIRELKEEETTETLSQKASEIRPGSIKIYVNKQEHFIYFMSITQDEYKTLRHSPDESYGFKLIEDAVILDKDEFCKNSKNFTLKTIKIFDELHADGLLKQWNSEQI